MNNIPNTSNVYRASSQGNNYSQGRSKNGKIHFLTLPAYGHVNPTLAIAQELVNRDQEVIYYLPEEFRETVEATGGTFHSYQSKLSRARVFVTHAGMNSVIESLYYGVPMAAVPQTQEQVVTARRIAELGLGIALEKETVNVATLREAVERVANDPALHQRVGHMQQLTRDAGGYKLATDAIIQFTREHGKG